MITLDVAGQLSLKQRLALLQLPPAKRKRMNGQMARKVRVAGRKNLRQQRNIDGTPWAARKGKSNRKMLRGLSKRMVTKGSAKAGVVSFNNHGIGRTARQQQDGLTEIMTASKMQRIHGAPNYSDPATRQQAKRLREAGFKARKKSGKGYKNVTIKYITEKLTMGQAGLILRQLTDKATKKSWAIRLPARSFLGVTEQQINAMVQTVFNQTINAKGR